MLSHLSIRTQITLLAGLLGMLLVGATSGVAMYLAQKRAIIVEGDAASARARELADALDRGMFERYREMQVIADLEVLKGAWLAHPANARSMLNTLQKSLPDYAWIGFARRNGIVHAATQGMLEGVDVSERPWFSAGMKKPSVLDVHEATLLANLLKPHTSGEPLRFVDVAVPARDIVGNVIGTIGAHLNWTWVEELKETLADPERDGHASDVWILSSEGIVLLGPMVGGKPFSDAHVASMLEAGSGGFIDNILGEETLTGFAVSDGFRDYPGLNWIVLARQPAAIGLAAARGRAMKIGAMGAAVAVLGLFLFALIGGKLGRPMRLLTEEADRIGRDPNYTMLPRLTGSYEIEMLSGALRSLLRRIGDAERRTAEAEQLRADEERRHSEDVDQLRRLADTDPLTGLLNRRSFGRNANEAMEHFRRNGRPFAVLVIDIDHFKQVNDNFGHAAGDEVIQHIGNLIRHTVRTPDRVARVGGEEFLALLHEVQVDDVDAMAERLRRDVQDAYLYRDKAVIKVTVSVGASVVTESDRDVEDVVARADAGLYKAKGEGRNRVVMQLAQEAELEEARAA